MALGWESCFRADPLAEPLRSDAEDSVHSPAVLYGDEWIWDVYGRMLHSVRTGVPAFEHVHGLRLFEYLERHPSAASLFHNLMRTFSAQEAEAVLAAYDFSDVKKVIDVGGGQGALVARLLARYRHLAGVVFDLPANADGPQRLLREAGVADRASFVGGDFFAAVPAGGDLYLLKSVLHN